MLLTVDRLHDVRDRELFGRLVKAYLPPVAGKAKLFGAEALVVHAEGEVLFFIRSPSGVYRAFANTRRTPLLRKAVDEQRIVAVPRYRIFAQGRPLVLPAAVVEHKFLAAFPEGERQLVLVDVVRASRPDVKCKVSGIPIPARAHYGNAGIGQETRSRLPRRRRALSPLARSPQEIGAGWKESRRRPEDVRRAKRVRVVEAREGKVWRNLGKRPFRAPFKQFEKSLGELPALPRLRRAKADPRRRRIEHAVVVERNLVVLSVRTKLLRRRGIESRKRLAADFLRVGKVGEVEREHIRPRHFYEQPVVVRGMGDKMPRLRMRGLYEVVAYLAAERRRLRERMPRGIPRTRKAETLLYRAPRRADSVEVFFRRDAARLLKPVRELPDKGLRVFLVASR